MKTAIQLSIDKPCHENWASFSATQRGGFCASCQTEVVDFTAMTDDEVKAYFKNFGKGLACGRMTSGQLKIYNLVEDKNSRSSNWFAWAVLSTSLFLAQQSKAAEIKNYAQEETEVKFNAQRSNIVPRDSSKVITGFVRNLMDSSRLAGVSVMVKNTDINAITNDNGEFTLTISSRNAADTLVFSQFGYDEVERIVSESASLDIAMNAMEFGPVDIMMGAIAVRYEEPKSFWEKIKDWFR